jgi:hypothetical protein
VPAGVLAFVVIVSVAVLAVVADGLKVAVAFGGRFDVESATDPFQFERVIVTVEVIVPCATVCADGLTDSVKFAAFWLTTTNVSVVELLSDPLVPVTVGLYVPAVGCPPPIVNVAVRVVVPAGTTTVAPEVVVLPTVQVALVPFGSAPAVSVTAEPKPFEGLIEMT